MASVGQTLKLESSKKFLHGHNSYLQNNHSLSCKTEHMQVMHAKKGSKPFRKNSFKNQGQLSQEEVTLSCVNSVSQTSMSNYSVQTVCQTLGIEMKMWTLPKDRS